MLRIQALAANRIEARSTCCRIAGHEADERYLIGQGGLDCVDVANDAVASFVAL